MIRGGEGKKPHVRGRGRRLWGEKEKNDRWHPPWGREVASKSFKGGEERAGAAAVEERLVRKSGIAQSFK